MADSSKSVYDKFKRYSARTNVLMVISPPHLIHKKELVGGGASFAQTEGNNSSSG
jgi:hypothetical protein